MALLTLECPQNIVFKHEDALVLVLLLNFESHVLLENLVRRLVDIT